MNIKTMTLAATLLSTTALAEPFTYQGSLQDAGAPANGEYDIRFSLFDAPVGGTQIGLTQAFENLQVTDGTFQVQLDFGNVYADPNRFLLIEVRDGDSGGVFTDLLPRTQLTATPKAQHALTADTVLNPQWTEAPGILHYGGGTDRVFVNRDSPITSAEYFGVHGDDTGFVGMYVSGPANSIPFYGYSIDNAISAYSYVEPSDDSWILVNDNAVALVSDADQNLTVSGDLNADGVNAGVVTAFSYNYSTAKLGYISVMGDAFHAASNDPFIASSGNGGAYIDADTTGWLVAPVQIPHGATITRVRFYFTDTNPTATMSMFLSRRTHGTNGFNFLANMSTNGFNGENLQAIDSVIPNPVVDNNLHSYHLRIYSTGWDGSNNMQIESAVIEYTTTQPD
ncbi:MAG: hypothetical protein JJ974_09835 [Phycisphaerales bacterium]|nr:hypothetical protein [Phycisphaerales bacterium]